MNRCQYAAIYLRHNRKYVFLRNIINLETGLLFRDHCWVKKFKLFEHIPIGSIIQFKAKQFPYKKMISETQNGMTIRVIKSQMQLIKLSNIEIVSSENGL